VNAFGAHFLTDAFSAGHLINKPIVTQFARERWDNAPTTGLVFKENAFTKAVAANVLADSRAGAQLRGMELKLIDWGEVTVTRFSEFLWQFARRTRQALQRVRAHHPRPPRRDQEAGGGVEVTSGGDKPCDVGRRHPRDEPGHAPDCQRSGAAGGAEPDDGRGGDERA
jgi:hypothetical protein